MYSARKVGGIGQSIRGASEAAVRAAAAGRETEAFGSVALQPAGGKSSGGTRSGPITNPAETPIKGNTHMTAVAVARSATGNHAAEIMGPPNERNADAIPLRAIALKWMASVGAGPILIHSGKQRAHAATAIQLALATAGVRMPYRPANHWATGIASIMVTQVMLLSHATTVWSQP
jgi:hypothetical protein